MRFDDNLRKIKTVQTFPINLKIKNTEYILKSFLQHKGATIDEGHYTSVVL